MISNDLSKIESGHLSLEAINFNLGKLIKDIVSLLKMRAEDNGTQIYISIHQDVPKNIFADEVRLRQVLINLVGNAIKFTKDGEIFISVGKRACDDNKKLKLFFSVKDTGIGIPASKQDIIFDKFSQADGSTTRKFGGTGLGLAICQKIVQMMSGDIGVKSQEGQGAEFWFTVEVQQSQLSQSDLDHDLIEKDTNIEHVEGFENVNILLVEDNQVNQMMAKEMLKELGCQVTVAANGKIAIQKVEQEEPFDVIFMDCQMPIMDGFEAASKISEKKRNKLIPAIPIIALTANAIKGDREKCISSGMDDYLSKPVRKMDLKSALVRWLPEEKHISKVNEEEQKTDLDLDRFIDKLPDINHKLSDSKLYLDISKVYEVKDLLQSFFDETIHVYFQETHGYIENIKQSLHSKNYDNIVENAHPLKSSSEGLGFVIIADIAAKIEESARLKQDNHYKELVLAIEDAVYKTREHLEKELQKTEV